MINYIDNMDCQEIAIKMYSAAKDIDFYDYSDGETQEISQLSEALYNIKAIAQNSCNSDYWRAFAYSLMLIFQD